MSEELNTGSYKDTATKVDDEKKIPSFESCVLLNTGDTYELEKRCKGILEATGSKVFVVENEEPKYYANFDIVNLRGTSFYEDPQALTQILIVLQSHIAYAAQIITGYEQMYELKGNKDYLEKIKNGKKVLEHDGALTLGFLGELKNDGKINGKNIHLVETMTELIDTLHEKQKTQKEKPFKED